MSWLKRGWLLIVLVLAFLFLQYKLWFSDSGLGHIVSLKHDLKNKQEQAAQAQERNNKLLAQVKHIQNSSEEIEAHARYDLGMVKADEEYLQVVTPENAVKQK